MENCKFCIDCNPYYFITYKFVRKCDFEVDETTYTIPLEMIKKISDNIVRVTFEKDSKNRLHMHAIVQLKHRPALKTIALKGFSANIKQIYDEENLHRYLDKERNGPFVPLKRLVDYLF